MGKAARIRGYKRSAPFAFDRDGRRWEGWIDHHDHIILIMSTGDLRIGAIVRLGPRCAAIVRHEILPNGSLVDPVPTAFRSRPLAAVWVARQVLDAIGTQ